MLWIHAISSALSVCYMVVNMGAGWWFFVVAFGVRRWFDCVLCRLILGVA